MVGIKVRDGQSGDVDRNRSGYMDFTSSEAKTGFWKVKIESDY